MSDDLINLRLKKFKLNDMDINSKVAIIGKPGTGKSTLIADLLYHHRKIPMGIIMSGTEESNSFYQGMVPDSFIYNDYDQKVIDKLLARQKPALRKKWPNHNVFMVLDDCMDDKKWIRHKTTRGIFKNGRHWKLFFILSMQYCMDITPELRTCLDYIFILKENILDNRIKLWKSYCGIFPTFDMFDTVMQNCTANYECLVIKNRTISNQIDEVAFWYKADLHNAFRVGSPSLWQYHAENYNPHYESDEDDVGENEVTINTAKYRRKRPRGTQKYYIQKTGY